MRNAAILLVSFACLTQAASAQTKPDLVGTWRLVEYWDRATDDQAKTYPYGEHPMGAIIYDRGGNVWVLIAKNPQPERLPKDGLKNLTADQLRTMLQEFVAYFGTYTVDAEKSIVTHHVAADVRRDYTGTDQPRPFKINGDELIIGDSKQWLRRLVRVK